MEVLGGLPSELVADILGSLGHQDLLNCRRVCKDLKTIIHNDSRLRLQLSLAMSGLEILDLRTPYPDQLERLHNLRKHWRTLDWTGTYEHPVGGSCHAYELVDGCFVQLDTEGKLLILRLPSAQDQKMVVLCEKDFVNRPADIALDPTQDVVAFLMVESNEDRRLLSLCVSSFSNPDCEAAPKARLPFEVTSDAVWARSVFRSVTQIMGDVIGVFVTTNDLISRFIIWNWRTGGIIVDSGREECLPMGAFTFSFLDTKHYYVTSIRDEGRIELYSFDPDGQYPGAIHVASLQLPDIGNNVMLHTFRAHCEPHTAEPSARTYTSSPDRKMHVFHLTYLTLVDFGRPTYTLYVPSSLLLKHTLSSKSARPELIRWEQWGPGTRLMNVQSFYPWLRYVHGSRVVCPPTLDHIRILDFNIQWSLPQGFSFRPGLEQLLCTTPSVVPRGSVFSKDVESCLPYLSSTLKMDLKYDSYMIDHERIVGLKTAGMQNERIEGLIVLTL
ncbi:hypothetical protein BKA70DRAFT_641092 [Coprinopsis sp. MPI-PUGE-AT-0042]|nr:hypothetical protein BKA70DRAFT_641092 [Coprinopsis sp. MPI-PUGE-AT-0042]